VVPDTTSRSEDEPAGKFRGGRSGGTKWALGTVSLPNLGVRTGCTSERVSCRGKGAKDRATKKQAKIFRRFPP
jgi:hypothetical protein